MLIYLPPSSNQIIALIVIPGGDRKTKIFYLSPDGLDLDLKKTLERKRKKNTGKNLENNAPLTASPSLISHWAAK